MSAWNDMHRAHDRELAEAMFSHCAEKSRVPGVPGVTRPSYSNVESSVLLYLEVFAQQFLKMETYRDRAGNLWFTNKNETQRLTADDPYVLTGSHVDSVACGGNFDGLVGVVAGILAVRRVGSTAVRAVALRGEESAWFGVPYKGSKAIFGKLDPSLDLLRAMSEQAIGYGSSSVPVGSPIVNLNMRAFVELHIEQGPILAQDWKVPVAAVGSISGNVRYKVSFKGEAAHSGTTPMVLRKDAVRAAAEFLEAAYVIGPDPSGRVTCGVIHTDAVANAGTRVPERCDLQLEYRSALGRALDSFDESVRSMAKRVEARRGVAVSVELVSRSEPVQLDDGLRRTISKQCKVFGYGTTFESGAGHDAAVFQENGIPSGMIFVRNQNGSHNPDEAMGMEDFMIGVDVLEKVLRELAP